MSPSRRYKISAVLNKTSQLCRVCQTGTANWGLTCLCWAAAIGVLILPRRGSRTQRPPHRDNLSRRKPHPTSFWPYTTLYSAGHSRINALSHPLITSRTALCGTGRRISGGSWRRPGRLIAATKTTGDTPPCTRTRHRDRCVNSSALKRVDPRRPPPIVPLSTSHNYE